MTTKKVTPLRDGFGAPVRLVARSTNRLMKGAVVEIVTTPTSAHGADARGVFAIGSYRCRYLRKAGGVGVLTIQAPSLPTPYHIVVKTWNESLERGREAVAAFKAGRAPARGVFRAATI